MVKTSPSNARGVGSISGQGAKIPCALGPKKQNVKQKQYCNKLNKDLKNVYLFITLLGYLKIKIKINDLGK